MQAVVIANPFAGTDSRRLDGPRAAALLEDLGYAVELVTTTGPGHAATAAREAAARSDLVVAVGGDGTMHEVGCGLRGTGTPLGVLPSGSGNDFAAGVGCGTVEAGLDAIAGGAERTLDVAHVDGEPFLNSLGLLASGLVSNRAARLWRFLGGARYHVAAARTLLGYRGQDCRWIFDGADETGGRWLLAEICNGPLTGGGFRFAPDADPADGWLDACLIAPVSLLTAFGLLPSAARGDRLEHESITLRRCRELRFTCAEPVAYHRDGEAGWLAAGSHQVGILESKLVVRVPREGNVARSGE